MHLIKTLWSKKMLVLLAASFCLNIANAYASIIKNDLTLVSNDKEASIDEFIVTGNDPYIIFNTNSLENNKRDGKLFLELDLGSKVTNVKIELFYKAKDQQFSPTSKLQYVVPSFPASLEIPPEISPRMSASFRLDLVDCNSCIIDLSSSTKIDHEPKAITIVKPLLSKIRQLPKQGHDFSNEEWRLNDLSGSIKEFQVSGDDPFIVSPLFSFSTNEFAGVYIQLDSPASSAPYNDYQLFYQTERHGFTSSARSTLRLSTDHSTAVSLFIPLQFINKETPQDHIIKRIRLDVPLLMGNWSLAEAKLVHQDEYSKYAPYIPKQLVNIKQQRAKGLSLIKKSAVNIWSDRGFTISYIILILIIIVLSIRLFRSAD